ncbi:hypothetical protein QZH41_019370 [Actinostola sp. cb2023]|nr:hypothetical protein QZH41_019370 [Actinostola sp. cb2023]
MEKKQKGFGYNLSAKLCLLRNFQYQKDAFTSIENIMSTVESEKENLELDLLLGSSRSSIGRIVADLWGEDGVKGKTIIRKGEPDRKGYKNLARRTTDCCENAIFPMSMFEKLCTDNIVNCHWHRVINNNSCLSFVCHEPWFLDGNRNCTEVNVELDNEQFKFEVKSQGFRIPVEEFEMTKQLRGLSVTTQVQIITEFIDNC